MQTVLFLYINNYLRLETFKISICVTKTPLLHSTVIDLPSEKDAATNSVDVINYTTCSSTQLGSTPASLKRMSEDFSKGTFVEDNTFS